MYLISFCSFHHPSGGVVFRSYQPDNKPDIDSWRVEEIPQKPENTELYTTGIRFNGPHDFTPISFTGNFRIPSKE